MRKFLCIFSLSFLLFSVNYCFGQWVSTNGPASGAYINCLAVNANYVFAGTTGGVYLSTDNGLSWGQATNGLSDATYIYSFAKSDTIIYAGTSGGVYLAGDTNNVAWQPANNGLSGEVTSIATAGTSIYAGTLGGGLYLSTDFGSNWANLNIGITDSACHSHSNKRNKYLCRNIRRWHICIY